MSQPDSVLQIPVLPVRGKYAVGLWLWPRSFQQTVVVWDCGSVGVLVAVPPGALIKWGFPKSLQEHLGAMAEAAGGAL